MVFKVKHEVEFPLPGPRKRIVFDVIDEDFEMFYTYADASFLDWKSELEKYVQHVTKITFLEA